MALQLLPLNGIDRIPAELMGQILDNTKDDTQTLHACCLVCVAWHSYLIDSLYKTIRLESRSRLDRLARTALIYPAVRNRLALARSVILEQGNRRSPGLAHVFPLVLGPHLHKVQHLTLRDCLVQPLHPSFFVKLRQLKDVKHLHLSGSPPQSFAVFHRIVRTFPQLEELDVAQLWRSSWNASQPTPPHILNLPCVPKLTCVRVSHSAPEYFRDLVVWLSLSGVCSTIRRLYISLSSVHSREIGLLNVLLARTASTLEHLHIIIPIKRLNDHWGFPQFLHLRVIDTAVFDSGDLTSTEDIQREFCNILASFASPALEHVRLRLHRLYVTTPSTQGMDSRDATTGAYRAQYADLHAVLARPIFSSLHRVTVVLYTPLQEELMSAKDVALGHLNFLRVLFAPWCVRGIANLACAISTIHKSWEVAVDKGEGPRYIDLRGRLYDFETALRVAGLDP